MLNTLILSLAALVGGPTVTWEAPSVYAEGSAFPVSVEIVAAADGSKVDSWLLNEGAFTLNGKSLVKHGTDTVMLPPGTKMSFSFDLGPAIAAAKAYNGKAFKLDFDGKYFKGETLKIQVAKPAPKGLDFMEVPLEELGNYEVLMETNRGLMWMEFFPENAPNHVRNFLDLCYTGFYNDVIFHRVIPGFMIQGGDPSGTGSGPGRRNIDSEFTSNPKYKHVPGILSMARTSDPNSASSQFFVMHGANPGLDNQYSVFGKLVDGLDVVDRIVTSPTHAASRGGPASTPNVKQVILSTRVILKAK
jgi:peptidyl-prolyl cis-trans isomerase B (cyclophilin B)